MSPKVLPCPRCKGPVNLDGDGRMHPHRWPAAKKPDRAFLNDAELAPQCAGSDRTPEETEGLDADPAASPRWWED